MLTWGLYLRRFRSLIYACILIFSAASFAQAQQINIGFSGSTPFSSVPVSATEAYPPPSERGGTYPGANVEVLLTDRFGVNAEGAFRYHEALYNGFQRNRPIFYSFNGLYAPRINKRITADFTAGVGASTVMFYNKFGACNFESCPITVTGTHPLLHVGGGPRYYFWHKCFVRPEANYYFVFHNPYHSDSVVRVGATIGFTIGPK